MKKTSLILLLIANVSIQISFGQTKSYNGSFNTTNFQGNATYDYIDDVDKRIFNGPFQFKNSVNSVSINGQYKADKKQGVWHYLYTNVASTDIFMKHLLTVDVLGNYQNGNLEGQWKLNRTKTISFNNNEITEYYKSQVKALSYLFDGKPVDYSKKTIVKEKSSANFTKNHFASNFFYSINEGSSVVNGLFDANGYYDSIWTIKYYDNNVLKIEFHHFSKGVLTLIKNKDNSTGDIKTVYDKTLEVTEFFQNYNEKENYSKIGQKFYKLQSGSLSDEKNPFLKDAINIWFNNTDLLSSNCAFEIERGSNKMTIYPLLLVVEDIERTKQYQQEQVRIKEAIDRKKRDEEAERQRIADEIAYQERKKIEAEEKAYREYEASDLGKLKKAIKLKYSVWLEKSEAESDKDYKKRIEEQSKTEFDKIVKVEIENSKKNTYTPKVISASLQSYNEDSSHFEINLFAEYSKLFNTPYMSFDVPKSLEPFFSNKFVSNKPGNGYPILAYILETTIIDNKWTPSKVFFVFDNSPDYGIDVYVWNSYSLINTKGKYTLERPGYSAYKPIKLDPIINQLSNKFLDSGIFYYEWSLKTNSIESTITIENLGINLPKL